MTTTSRPTALVERESRAAQDKFYVGLDDSAVAYTQKLSRFAAGDRVLELGCGIDGGGFDLAARGVDVVAICSSVELVDRARDAAAERGLSTIEHHTMSPEDPDLADDSFDGVIGATVLHDLDMARAYAEMARVLQPDGRAVFIEPLGHNPLINAYRRRTPESRDAHAHPVRREDISLAGRWFRDVDVDTFHLLSVLAGPIADRRGGRRLQVALAKLDRTLVERAPGIRWQAWIAVLELRGPR